MWGFHVDICDGIDDDIGDDICARVGVDVSASVGIRVLDPGVKGLILERQKKKKR